MASNKEAQELARNRLGTEILQWDEDNALAQSIHYDHKMAVTVTNWQLINEIDTNLPPNPFRDREWLQQPLPPVSPYRIRTTLSTVACKSSHVLAHVRPEEHSPNNCTRSIMARVS